MKLSWYNKGIIISVLAVIFFSSACLHADEEKKYLLATAGTEGTYYPVGVAIATLTKVKLQPALKISMSAINSAGSGENIKLLRDNEAHFAIVQGLFGYYAWSGKGPIAHDGPQKNLRSISMLWQNVEHFAILSKYARTGTIDDMLDVKGKRLSLGKKYSGTIGSNTVLLGNLGLDVTRDFDLVYDDYTLSVDALLNGEIAGFGIPAGMPANAVTRAFASMGQKITLLSFNEEQAQKADGGLALWTPFLIPKEAYPGLEKDVMSIAQPNFLAVRSDVDEETVYQITKTIYNNLPFLRAIHKATGAMSLQKALSGLPIPLHPGALKYYRERGLEIPENLRAQ